MNKLNFVSEGNSIIHYDLEKENEKFYASELNIINNSNTEQINYFYKEINKKNKQITELKSIISTLKKSQETLLYEIKSLQNKIPSYKNNVSQQESKNGGQEKILLSKIKKLQNENTKLKMRINKSQEKENLFYNNINNKLLKAERDIQILSFENKSNNNIILAIQNFLFNVSDKINSENNSLIFDLSLIDNNTFIRNLQILEANILNKINQLNNIGNICLSSSRKSNTIMPDEIDNCKKNNYTINENENNDKKFKNLKKMIKPKKEMNTINYLYSHNRKRENRMGIGTLYNTLFEKNKNNRPLRIYNLRNNYFKELGLNDDIRFNNKSSNANGGRNNHKKKNN
jgi:hypothetical protein